MKENFKYILGFIAAISFIALCFYGIHSYRDFKHEEIELTREENKRDAENDSLKKENQILQLDRERYMQDITTIETQKQGNYKTYKEKSKSDTQKPASEQGLILKELINK